MVDQFEIIDLYKALLALAGGVILGLERELKDKAAGLKTITIICLGSALFTIISEKVGGQYTDSSRIASYIVSGIGFLGAGVIFKDGVNVSGLTTASVIWLAAAIGMSIGFGEMYTAGIFLAVAMTMIYVGNWISVLFPSAKASKLLTITVRTHDAHKRQEIIDSLDSFVDRKEEKKVVQKGDYLITFVGVTVESSKLPDLQNHLIAQKDVVEFEV